MRVLSPAAMREVDRRAIEELGVPGMVLMENAAIGLADALGRAFPDAADVTIFCGPGNNGGDGLALGRHLAVRGYRARLVLAFEGREPGGDAGRQLAICRALADPRLELLELGGEDDPASIAAAAAAGADLVVDALFGTGLGRPLEGRWAELVRAISALPLPRLAVDLPSGLAGGRSDLFGPHVVADLTVTFAAPKPAQIFPPAARAVGELVVVDLGIPERLIEEAEEDEDGPLHLLTAEEAAGLVAPRAAASHKGDHGHLLVVAGGPGKAGAAILAARAAVRAGAGLVTVAAPAPLVATVDLGSLESMSLGLSADEGGTLAADRAAAAIAEAAAGKDAVALGPGLGPRDGAGDLAAALRRAVVELEVPLVLDADGLNAFAGRAGELARRTAPTILTPHPGELGRLLGLGTAEIAADRPAAARRAARETGAIVVLKGHQSLVSLPENGALWVNPTGNPGMASGGTGDVLTGLLGALLAQGYEPADAALLGVYLHGLAGDLAAAERGETGLAAGDLAETLPRALRRLVHPAEPPASRS